MAGIVNFSGLGSGIDTRAIIDAILNAERCHVDTARLGIIGRLRSPGGYIRTSATFEMPMRGHADWLKEQG